MRQETVCYQQNARNELASHRMKVEIKQLFLHQEERVHMQLLIEWQKCTLHGLSVDLKVQWVRIQLIDRSLKKFEENLEQAYLCLLLREH